MFDARFNSAHYISFSTQKRDGSTVETPVWFAQRDDKIYIYSKGNAGKVKRLRNFPQSRIAICGVRGALKSEWLPTDGRIIDDEAEKKLAYNALKTKYGWKLKGLDFFARLGGAFQKRDFMVITARKSTDN